MYDVMTIGRSSIDLYSNNIGTPFHEIDSFNAYVGGSSTNIAVGCARLDLNAVLLTAVGDDKVGEFILHFLKKEKIPLEFIPVIKDKRSSAVLLGVQPPDCYPLVYYRDNAADIFLTREDLDRIGVENCRMIVPSGTALSKNPSRDTINYGLHKAKQHDVQVLLDLDFRKDQWQSIQDYQASIFETAGYCDIILATTEEVLSAFDPNVDVSITQQQISSPDVLGDLATSIERCFQSGISSLVLKRGDQGARIYYTPSRFEDVPGFQVEVFNTLGAGDAFAAGFIKGFLSGWPMKKAVRYANACGAIVVTRHGCANFNPYAREVSEFLNEYKDGL